MNFSHCDHDEKYLTLHDCKADRAYLRDGKLGFEFDDGFWIMPEHPGSNLPNTVRTDLSKAEYTLADGNVSAASVYVFKRTLFGRVIRTEWTLAELAENINSGKCELEILYQFIDGVNRIVECALRFKKRPYFGECMIKLTVSEVGYYWNDLCEDRVW